MELFKLLGTIAIQNAEAIDAIKNTTDQAEESSNNIDVAFEKIGSAAIKVGKVMATALAAGVAAISALTKASLDAYAQYEQLTGGVETLFGAGGMSLQEYADSLGKTVEEVEAEYNKLMTAQETVMANADEAYKTAGMSANQYMETVTSFSASLIQSLDGDTARAAEVANQAIIDMSDNANKMGTDMQMIQNAYNGFAKQNYMMLDNLKLGYGGTKEEMERLLADAEKLSGVEYDISSYADIVDAIHVVQTEMGITGTTAKEASETISGSLASMKASWSNLVTGLGNDQADLTKLIDEFVESTATAAGNVIPRIEIILKGIADLIAKIVPQITKQLPSMIKSVLPSLIKAASSLIQGLADALPDLLEMIIEALPDFVQLGVDIITQLIEGIGESSDAIGEAAVAVITLLIEGIMSVLSKLTTVGMKLISSFMQGIGEAFPDLLKNVVSLIIDLVNSILEELPMFIEAGLEMIKGVAQGILEAIPALLEALPEVINNIVTALLEAIPLIIETGVELLTALVDNLPIIIDTIIEVLPQIIDGIINALIGDDGEGSNLSKIIQAGVDLFIALVQNIDEIILGIVAAIPALIDGIVDSLLSEDNLSNMFDAGVDIIYSFFDGLKSAWEEVKSWFIEASSTAISAFGGTPTADFSAGKNSPAARGNKPSTRSNSNGSSVGGGKRYGVYAEGGVVPKGQIAFLEGQGAEAVVPLERTEWINKVAQNMDSSLGGNGTAQKLDRLIALQESMLEIMPELANISISLNNREFGRAVRQVNA